MKTRIGFLVLSSFLVMAITVACENKTVENDTVREEELPVMTMEEVSRNDGKDGNSAHVVVEGIVYDVTDLDSWADGEHNGHNAGQDLTEEIKNDSPHGIEKLEEVEAIGRVED